jgi:hypothetical protein
MLQNAKLNEHLLMAVNILGFTVIVCSEISKVFNHFWPNTTSTYPVESYHSHQSVVHIWEVDYFVSPRLGVWLLSTINIPILGWLSPMFHTLVIHISTLGLMAQNLPNFKIQIK